MENARFPIFAERFNQLRGESSIIEFAELLGMSRQTVGFYLNGTRIPDALTLRQISEKCSVSADWLLGLSDVREQDAEIRQICNYTGLSEAAVLRLHEYTEIFSKHITNIVADLINKLCCSTSISYFRRYAWRSAISFVAAEKAKKNRPDDYSYHDEMIKINDELLLSARSPIVDESTTWAKIPYHDASVLYRREASRLIELSADTVVRKYSEKMYEAIMQEQKPPPSAGNTGRG